MKILNSLPLILFTATCAFAQTNYEWNATLIAVDEMGNPIGGADADIGYYANSKPVNARGVTDTNGVFTASHSALASMAEVSCQAEKSGYYSSWKLHILGPNYDPAKWTFTETLGLKKVGKPIAMYAKQITKLKFPELNKAIGYDLATGDWAAPYGKGINPDVFFMENHKDAKSGYTFTVSFPNPGDGIQDFATDESLGKCGLRSSHEAPLDGYQSTYEQTHMADPNRNYYFRVRTVLDLNGGIKSALYGKIYGDFMNFGYYLNPTPNDRNIEFDPARNLMRGLQSFEQVTAP